MTSRLTERLVRALCDPAVHEELLGDLAELSARRAPTGPIRRAVRRAWDVASICARQSRLRTREVRLRVRIAALGAVALLIAGGLLEGDEASSYTVRAHDAAGLFSLELMQGRVIAASVDGLPIAASRIVQRGAHLVLKGGDAGRDLEISLTSGGGIRWQGRGGVPDTLPIELAWAREYLGELESATQRDTLWGVPLIGPLLFADRQTRFVAANVPDSAGLLTERDGLWVGALPDDENVANTSLEWAGVRWSMIVWPPPDEGYDRRRLLFHEQFHRIQPALGLPAEDPPNGHLAERDGRIWMRLEWRALAEALLRQGDERRRAVEDALAFRARRHALYPNAPAQERALELNEGLAEYTGLAMSGLPGSALADRAAVLLARRDGAENFSRSFAYATGPAYGILLDEAGVDWRGEVTSSFDLAAAARRAYQLGPVTDAGAEARARRYDGARIIAQEHRAAEEKAARDARVRARFVEGPTLALPVRSRFRYRFDPNDAFPIAGLGTVYGSARVTDEWGVLEVTAGGVLMERPDRQIVGVVVPLAADTRGPPLSGDGWTLTLADGWELEPAERAGSWVAREH